MVETRAFKRAGIKNLITRNYGIPVDEVDIDSLMDSSLSMSENWHNIFKPIIKVLSGKHGKEETR